MARRNPSKARDLGLFSVPFFLCPLRRMGAHFRRIFGALFGGLFVANPFPPTPFRNLRFTWRTFRPRKKIFSPPTPPKFPNSPQTPFRPLRLEEPPPLLEISIKIDLPPPPAPRTPPSPSPSRKKIKNIRNVHQVQKSGTTRISGKTLSE